MTNGEALELLFNIRLSGQAELDRLPGTVQSVSSAAVLAATDLSSLERSLNALTAAVTSNTAALSSQERGFDGVAGGARRAGEAARASVTEMQAASAAIRGLDGSMNIRAAERFISTISGIGPILQAAFPVFGFLALESIFDTIIGKVEKWANAHNPVLDAQRESLSLLEQQGKEYDRLADKLHKLQLDEYERGHGRDARLRLEAHEHSRSASQEDADQIATLQRLLAEVNHISTVTGGRTSPLTAEDIRLPGQLHAALGLKPEDKTGVEWLNGKMPGMYPDLAQAQSASELSVGLDQALATARMQQRVDTASASDLTAKADADERKKSTEERTKAQRELEQAEKQAAAYLRQAQTFELTGLAKINEVYREKLELLGKTEKAVNDINAAYAIEVGRELEHIQKNNRAQLGKYLDQTQRDDDRSDRFGAKQFLAELKKQIEQDKKDIESGLKVLQTSDDSDANAVRRSLGVTLKGNSLAVAGGRMSGQSAASADYDARVAAAREVFQIETQHLDLIAEQDKRDEQYASARKKRDSEIYRAAEQYENQLQTLREKDLQKYQQMAGSLFDAIHGHTVSQWFKEFAVGQEKQVFTNLATKPLQQIGSLLGTVTGGNDFGGLLNGTVLDPKNAAQTTATQTTRTADEIVKMRGDLRAMSGLPASTISADGGSGLNYSPLKGTGLDVFGSDVGGWTGNASGMSSLASSAGFSSLFKAGTGSTVTQFFSGLTGMGSNPLQAVFGGMSTNGDTVTQLTGAQRAGAAVGTATALAGAGLGIASGIEQGGVGGYTKAASSGLGAAALLDPEPISKTVLGALSAVTGMVGSFFTSGPQQRQKDITDEIAKSQYLAPTALNVIQSMGGLYEDFDARGNLRTSTMSAVPTVAEPYITKHDGTYYDVPGGVTKPYSGGATGSGSAPVSGGTTVVVQGNLQAMDSESFHDFLQKTTNSHAVGESLASHLERHDGRAANAIRYIAGN